MIAHDRTRLNGRLLLLSAKSPIFLGLFAHADTAPLQKQIARLRMSCASLRNSVLAGSDATDIAFISLSRRKSVNPLITMECTTFDPVRGPPKAAKSLSP